MLETYSGATRIYPIIGDPIAQVKSPNAMTRGFAGRGIDAIVVPIHATPETADAILRALGLVHNIDGIIATVPHKFRAFTHCATATDRARLLGAANLLRRNSDGGWHGDMVDGLTFVAAFEAAAGRIAGARVLLAGAGGAGSAIALALLDAGARAVAIHDADAGRREALLAKLAAVHPDRASAGTNDATGFDIVVNATPAGMRADDTQPFRLATLQAGQRLADIITVPEMTPLLQAAASLGCPYSTGNRMVATAVGVQVEFFLGGARPAGAPTRAP